MGGDVSDDERFTPRAASVLYFFLFLNFAAQGRFSSLFFSELGLSNAQVGLVLAAGSTVDLPARAAVASLFDRFDSPLVAARTVLVASAVGSSLCVLAYGAGRVQPIPFWWALCVRCFFCACQAPAYSCTSALAMRCLPDKREWGRTRLWGAVSWGLFSAAALGPSIDRWGAARALTVASCGSGAALVAAALLTLRAPRRRRARAGPDGGGEAGLHPAKEHGGERRAARCAAPRAARRALARLLRAPPPAAAAAPDGAAGAEPARPRGSCAPTARLLSADGAASRSFFSLACIFGACTSLVEGLVFLYWAQELGASSTLCGISVLVTVSFEVPLFVASRWLVSTFSPRALLGGACVAYTTRVLWYAAAGEGKGWTVLLVEPLHGVTYSLGALGSVHYAASLARDGEHARAQALTDNLRALGGIGATLGGGFVMQTAGPRALYSSSALLMACALGAYLCATSARDSRARRVCEAPPAPVAPDADQPAPPVDAAEEPACDRAADAEGAKTALRSADAAAEAHARQRLGGAADEAGAAEGLSELELATHHNGGAHGAAGALAADGSADEATA